MPETATYSLSGLSGLDRRLFDTSGIYRGVVGASRQLAELKGAAATIPNQAVLVSTLTLQEAKDSSAIENIVTTHDELFKSTAFPDAALGAAAKEVRHYSQALKTGFELVQANSLLTNTHVLEIQKALEGNNAGFRKLPGTLLKDGAGRVVYTPPQEHQRIVELMTDLEQFVNDDSLFAVDPLVKMAIIHHQFESIHPFYDGNGRTGRIINMLYLVKRGLLDIPVLHLSRYIVRTRSEYYRLLQLVRDDGAWELWVQYMLAAVEWTARDTMRTIIEIREAMLDYKHRLRANHRRLYSQDLINNLFRHPYTKIEFVMNDLGVSRLTATRYLDLLSASGFVAKHRMGRANYYVNLSLADILIRAEGRF